MNGRVLTCCIAVGCNNESEIVLSYRIRQSIGSEQNNTIHDELCEEHAYEFFTYFSNYLGLKVRVKRINRPVKVKFT